MFHDILTLTRALRCHSHAYGALHSDDVRRSLIATIRAIGLTEDFLARWLPAWGLSWLVAFPTLLLVLPLVRRIVNALVEPQRS